jgi:hypothetical protein
MQLRSIYKNRKDFFFSKNGGCLQAEGEQPLRIIRKRCLSWAFRSHVLPALTTEVVPCSQN